MNNTSETGSSQNVRPLRNITSSGRYHAWTRVLWACILAVMTICCVLVLWSLPHLSLDFSATSTDQTGAEATVYRTVPSEAGLMIIQGSNTAPGTAEIETSPGVGVEMRSSQGHVTVVASSNNGAFLVQTTDPEHQAWRCLEIDTTTGSIRAFVVPVTELGVRDQLSTTAPYTWSRYDPQWSTVSQAAIVDSLHDGTASHETTQIVASEAVDPPLQVKVASD